MKVFLGGTCAESKWRDELIEMLEIDSFNPIVSDWDSEAQQRELEERESCDFVLYVITPEMQGVYSIAEVVDDSNKQPDKTLFCVLQEGGNKEFTEGQLKSLSAVMDMVDRNGALVFADLEDIADWLNAS